LRLLTPHSEPPPSTVLDYVFLTFLNKLILILAVIIS
jgi:hypothetical protein